MGRTEEKADIGRRVEWAGAGLHLGDSRPDPRRIRCALERLDDGDHRAGARAVAASLAGRDPGRDGAALVERLVTERSGTTTR